MYDLVPELEGVGKLSTTKKLECVVKKVRELKAGNKELQRLLGEDWGKHIEMLSWSLSSMGMDIFVWDDALCGRNEGGTGHPAHADRDQATWDGLLLFYNRWSDEMGSTMMDSGLQIPQ
jgi:hypothetical protein